MSKRKILGWSIVIPIGLVGLYILMWVMGYWGGYKPLFSLPEAIATVLFALFMLGLHLVMEHDNA